jgi:hypothetical protein
VSPPDTAAPRGAAGAPPVLALEYYSVTVQMPSVSDVDQRFSRLAATLGPDGPCTISPIKLQSILRHLEVPQDSQVVAEMKAAYLNVLQTDADPGDPKWPDGVSPMLWLLHADARDWWQAYKATPRPPFPIDMFPFAYDFSKNTTPKWYATARGYNNQALDALFNGDQDSAVRLLAYAAGQSPGKSEGPTEKYIFGIYNLGTLLLCRQELGKAADKFATFDTGLGNSLFRDHTAKTDPIHGSDLPEPEFKYASGVGKILQHDSALDQERHGIDDCLSAAWAFFTVGQYRAAVLYAGKASAMRGGDHRPEPELLAALVCARLRQPDQTVRWLQDSSSTAQSGTPSDPDATPAYPTLRDLLNDVRKAKETAFDPMAAPAATTASAVNVTSSPQQVIAGPPPASAAPPATVAPTVTASGAAPTSPAATSPAPSSAASPAPDSPGGSAGAGTAAPSPTAPAASSSGGSAGPTSAPASTAPAGPAPAASAGLAPAPTAPARGSGNAGT